MLKRTYNNKDLAGSLETNIKIIKLITVKIDCQYSRSHRVVWYRR